MLLNIIEQNYSTIEREALAMVFALHKFRHYLLGNKFVFYVDHMALAYIINKPQVSRRITRWLLLFLKYDFIILYINSVSLSVSPSIEVLKPISLLIKLSPRIQGPKNYFQDLEFLLLTFTFTSVFA